MCVSSSFLNLFYVARITWKQKSKLAEMEARVVGAETRAEIAEEKVGRVIHSHYFLSFSLIVVERGREEYRAVYPSVQ